MQYVLHFGPDALHVDMEGKFTFNDSSSFQKLMSAIRKNDSRGEIRLNISKLASIDATALRLLMMAHDAAKRLHTSLVFEGAAGSVLAALTEASRYNMLNLAVA